VQWTWTTLRGGEALDTDQPRPREEGLQVGDAGWVSRTRRREGPGCLPSAVSFGSRGDVPHGAGHRGHAVQPSYIRSGATGQCPRAPHSLADGHLLTTKLERSEGLRAEGEPVCDGSSGPSRAPR